MAASCLRKPSIQPNYYPISKSCNLWRNFHDVQTSWVSVATILNYYEENYEQLAPYHGPGHWNDPDMLVFGTGVLTRSQSRRQIAMMAMLSAPILLSCNMKLITPYEKELLLNLNLIAVAQDTLGIMATPYLMPDHAGITAWVKPHLPMKGDLYPSYTIAVVNKEMENLFGRLDLSWFDLNATDGYTVMNVFTGEYFLNVSYNGVIELELDENDVAMFTLYPL